MLRFFILLILVPTSVYAQVNDSFNDNNFNENPQWNGNTAHFIVDTNGELQLQASEAGISYLSTPSKTIEEASWEVRLKMDFNPSSSNLARIYLASDKEDLTAAENALYLEVGGTDDNLCLYQISDGKKTKHIEGIAKKVDLAYVDIVIKVSRTNNDWIIRSDVENGWQTDGEATFPYLQPSSYFGVYCKYTKTRVDKFFIDDIVVSGQEYQDRIPPEIIDFKHINGSLMKIKASEDLYTESIKPTCFTIKESGQQAKQTIWNATDSTVTIFFDPIIKDAIDDTLFVNGLYDLNNNVINDTAFAYSYQRIKTNEISLKNAQTLYLSFSEKVPPQNFDFAKLIIDDKQEMISSINNLNNKKEYELKLTSELLEGVKYRVQIQNLVDSIGDPIVEIDTLLSYYFAKRFDIVINELMADPTPSMGLPETEYIEFYNRSNQDIRLQGWSLKVNSRECALPDSTIKANSFFCCVPSSNVEDWEQHSNIIAIKNWPAINNSAADIVLSSPSNTIIDAWQYDAQTINGEPFKQEGGWSAERLDFKNQSSSADNYSWCMNLNGGTPAVSNSVAGDNPDEINPTIKAIQLVNDTLLHIQFSECMLFEPPFDLTISPEPSDFILYSDSVFLKFINLHFHQKLPINTVYKLQEINIKDLANNPLLMDDNLLFGVSDTLEKGDVLINEVLFNPYPDGYDFVELYNRSDKLLDASDLFLADINNNQIEKLRCVSESTQLIMPRSYFVSTTNKESLIHLYNCPNPDAIIESSTLPSYPDEGGTVAITNYKGVIIDEMDYNAKMHSDLLKDDEGVSLERLSCDVESNNPDNWFSAASSVGYATPTYANSRSYPENSAPDKNFSIEPEVFTPDNNGIEDLLYIHYNNSEPDALVSIRVYNSTGSEICYIANNESIANKGYFTWNGLSEERQLQQPGIYIIYIQCTYPSGKVTEEKYSCVIGVNNQN